MIDSIPRRAFAVLLLLTTVGCTLGPDAQRPVTVVDEAESYVHATGDTEERATATGGTTEVSPWWRTFADPATAELVEAALTANTDLRVAAARVLEAEARVKSARGARLPQVTGDVGVNRSESSFTLPQVGRVSVRSTTYSAGVDVAYQLDLFGRLKRTQEAAWSDLLAEEAARETVVHSVIAGVVRTRAQLSTQARAAEVARRTRDSWSETLETTERRYRAGLNSALDLRLARENRAAAEAAVVQAELAEQQTRLALDVLLGRRPGTGEAPEKLLAPLPDLGPVPLGLPAELLDRRPDLRQAELRLAAETARVGVAMANLFPSLSLTGRVGGSSDAFSDLVSSESFIYNAIANLVTPIFTGGQRRADVAAAKARVERLTASYAGAILQALREVEDALLRDTAVRKRLKHLETRLEEARGAHGIAQERYRRGVLPLLQVLETERRLRQAEEARVAAQGESWNVRVDLLLALGGDWTPEPAEAALTPSTPNTSDSTTSSEEDAR